MALRRRIGFVPAATFLSQFRSVASVGMQNTGNIRTVPAMVESCIGSCPPASFSHHHLWDGMQKAQMNFSSTPAGAGGGSEKLFQCSQCKKAFRLVNALNHHIKIKHGGDAKVIVVGPDGKPIEGAQLDDQKEAPQEKVTRKFEQVPGIKPPTSPISADAPKDEKADTSQDKKNVETPKVASDVEGGKQASGEQSEKISDEDIDKKLFVCTICQKGFRIEAALQHHYQAKHGMEMPTAAKTTSSATITDATGATAGSGSAPKEVGMQYIHPSDSEAPQPPNYHFDVAPNAPEESEIAIHHRCVNQISLIGTIQDIQNGYVFEDPCIQFILATDFENPSPGDPDKDFHTVRILSAPSPFSLTASSEGDTAEKNAAPESGSCIGGTAFLEEMKATLHNGDHVLVSGRLRMIPQFEHQTNKYYHFPIVQVVQGGGEIVLLESQVERVAEEKAGAS